MNLTIDIEERSNAIQKELGLWYKLSNLFIRYNILGFKKWLLYRRGKQLGLKHIKLLDDFILSLEGFQGHISELKLEAAEDVLSELKKAIHKFERSYEKYAELSADDYHLLNERLERLQYLLKTLYRTEALLHVATTIHLPVTSTPVYIKQALSRMSQQALLKSVYSDFNNDQVNEFCTESAQASFNEFWKDEDDAYCASNIEAIDHNLQREKLSFLLDALQKASTIEAIKENVIEITPHNFIERVTIAKSYLKTYSDKINALIPKIEEVTTFIPVKEVRLNEIKTLIKFINTLAKSSIQTYSIFSSLFIFHKVNSTELDGYKQSIETLLELVTDLREVFFVLPNDEEFQRLNKELSEL